MLCCPHGRSLRVLPAPRGGRKFPWGGPAGIQPPRSLTSCASPPPTGPQIPLGRPGGNSAPTVAHCVCSLPPEGAANSLGAARREFSPHGRSLRVLPAPRGGRKFP